MDIDEDSTIECYGIGDPCYIDNELKFKFFKKAQVHNLDLSLGDIVKVKLDNVEISGDYYGYGIITAFYEDDDETMYSEVKWFFKPNDLNAKARKKYNAMNPIENELIESEDFDDIPIGSIEEIITIQDYKSDNIYNPSSINTSLYFTCRYKYASESNTLIPVNVKSLFHRSFSQSEYQYAYQHDELVESLTISDDDTNDPYSKAISNLHISVIPNSLPCRQKEQEMVDKFIRTGIENNGSRTTLYISGMPGSGKTATVLAVIQTLKTLMIANKFEPFYFLEINCLRLRKPTDAYCKLWNAISGQHLSPIASLRQLNNKFDHTTKMAQYRNFEKKHPVVICLLDEVDFLSDKKVIHNMLNWPSLENSGLVMIGIANSMDLPDKFKSSLASRIQNDIQRIPFPPYRFNEIEIILEDRIKYLNLPNYNKDLATICARKAAAYSGDLRTALKIFQKSLELFRDSGIFNQKENTNSANSLSNNNDQLFPGPSKFKLLVELVTKAAELYRSSPPINIIQKTLSKLDHLILIAYCRNIKITGGEKNILLYDLYDRYLDVCQYIHENPVPNISIFTYSISNLLSIDLFAIVYQNTLGNFTSYNNYNLYSFTNGLAGGLTKGYDYLITCRLEYGDILGALKESTQIKHIFDLNQSYV